LSVFLDANVLFSGSREGSDLFRFLVWLDEKERLVTSRYVREEAERNILLKRADWHESFQELLLHIELIMDAPLFVEAGLPDKDKPVLGAAIAAKCAYLVTGDKKDFGHLYGKTIGGVTVVSVLELAKIMLEKHKV
jgi:predicted nucleic acid-binding protein